MTDLNFKSQLAGPRAVGFVPPAPVKALRAMDEGVRVIAEIVDGDGLAVDVRAATTKLMKLMKPDGTTQDIGGLLFSNGADGKVYFVSSASVPPFSQTGEWKLQVKIIIGGVAQSTKWVSFVVEPNIDAN